ncbi:MAG: DUF2378 family protein [Acidobacteria bacterium]|nr:DUF2378 family protein [Acidobacteriota bacterium]
MEITHVRASMLRGLRALVLQRDGEGGWLDLVRTLPQEAQGAFLREPSLFTWLPTPQVNALVAAFEARHGIGTTRPRVAAAVERELAGTHPWMLGLLNPVTLLQHADTVFHFYLRGGEIRLETLGPGSACLLVRGTGLYSHWFSDSFPAWLQRALELMGAPSPGVSHQALEDGVSHRYRVSWEP